MRLFFFFPSCSATHQDLLAVTAAVRLQGLLPEGRALTRLKSSFPHTGSAFAFVKFESNFFTFQGQGSKLESAPVHLSMEEEDCPVVSVET